MIQFNLLPDVKMAYIKAARTKRMVITISVLATSVSLAVFVLLLVTVNVAQKKNLSDLNADITKVTAEVKATPNLDKILTIQSQLASVSGLHDQKPVASRMFDFVGQVTPSNVTIANITSDFTLNTTTITGAGPDLDAINTFVDTLKFTTYTTDKNNEEAKAFTNVVLSAFSRTSTGATYTITLSYDPQIYNITNKVQLKVPNTITTRSVTEQPKVFQEVGIE